MAWQLLASALPAAAQLGSTYLNRPKKEDYKPQTDYMKKYVGYLRGRSASKDVLHMAMQPQLRNIGSQGAQMQKQIGYDVAKTGIGGSGLEAQMRLSAGQQTQEALSAATDRAVGAQMAETNRLGEKIADVNAQIAAEEQRANQAYKTATSQWKGQLAGQALGLGASIATAGISQANQMNQAKLLAERSGFFGDSENIDRMIKDGWTKEMFQAETAKMNQKIMSILGNQNLDSEALSDIRSFIGLPPTVAGLSQNLAEDIDPVTNMPPTAASGTKPEDFPTQGEELTGKTDKEKYAEIIKGAEGVKRSIERGEEIEMDIEDSKRSFELEEDMANLRGRGKSTGQKPSKAETTEQAYLRSLEKSEPSRQAYAKSVDRATQLGGKNRELDLAQNPPLSFEDWSNSQEPTFIKAKQDAKKLSQNMDSDYVKYKYSRYIKERTGSVEEARRAYEEALSPEQKPKKKLSKWEQHLKFSGGKSKYFKNEEEFLESLKKYQNKHKHLDKKEEGTLKVDMNEEGRKKAKKFVKDMQTRELKEKYAQVKKAGGKYTVAANDTVSSISKNFNITFATLKELNPELFDADGNPVQTIKIGQKIRLI